MCSGGEDVDTVWCSLLRWVMMTRWHDKTGKRSVEFGFNGTPVFKMMCVEGVLKD